MNDCANADIRDRLPELVHGSLASSETAVIEAHVARCIDCQQELAIIQGVRTVLLNAARPVDIAAVVSALPAPRMPARRGAPVTAWRAAAAAAVLLAAAATAVIVSHSTTSDVPLRVAAVVPAQSVDSPDSAFRDIAPGDINAPRVALAATSSQSTTASGAELTVATSLESISDGQMASLIDQINSIEAIPLAEPVRRPVVPVLLADSIGVKELGGSY